MSRKQLNTYPWVLSVISLLLVYGCAATDTQTKASINRQIDNELSAEDLLAGTSWQLVKFQSMSDSVGTIQPVDARSFVMRLNADGSLFMRLGCNRGQGRWTASASPGAMSGSFSIEGLATTRALCPPPQLDQRISGDAQYVRSYVLQQDRLFLSLFADGGIYEWQLLGNQEGK